MTEEGRRSALKLTFSGVQLDIRPSDHFVDGDWHTVQLAPLWIFQVIAGVDKKVDEKEHAALVATLKAPSESKLAAFVFTQVIEKLDDFEKARATDKREPMRALGEVETLLGRYPNAEEANDFRRALVDLATKIAAASGGGLFGLGSKVSEEEASAIDRLRLLFRVSATE